MKVFVYGTLKRGYHNHHMLGTYESLGEGATANAIFDMKEMAYPVAFLRDDRRGFRIAGEVYSVSQETMNRLDALEAEGDMYERVVVSIKMNDGRDVSSWMYIGREDYWKNANLLLNSKINRDWALYWGEKEDDGSNTVAR